MTENNEDVKVDDAAEQQPQQERDTKWYVLRVVSGKERKVKEYLDKDIARNDGIIYHSGFSSSGKSLQGG